MAGDWIKVETTTPDKEQVHQIAEELQISPEAVVGHLFRVWIWADQHSISGDAISVTDVTLDSIAHVAGMAKAMRNAGWLVGAGKIGFPKFDRHNGKTAKNRALTKDRMKRHRDDGNVTPPSPEKRREEKKIESRDSLRSSPITHVGGNSRDLTPTKPTTSQITTGPAWDAYEFAYAARYRAAPKRNARVNGQMASFVRLVGKDEAPGIVEFYLRHNDARYVREGHSVGMLVAHAEKLHTEWSTGRRVTTTAAQQADKLQATGDVFGKLIEEAREHENS